MKKRKKRTILLLLILAILIMIPAYCRRAKHKGLYFVNKKKSQPNLIIVTHGWIHKGKGYWPEKMAKAIDEKVDSDQWYVGYFDWGKGSATIDPVDAVIYARDIAGSALAGQILKLGKKFEHIHLIGHSCGAWVISEAAKILVPQIECDTHLTFLDAYVPLDWQQELLGDINYPADVNCWAEHYYTKDIMTSKVTEYDLKHAHNVDITEVDQMVKDHKFPFKWYHASITGKYPEWSFMDDAKLVTKVDGIEYGFARSKEVSEENWEKSLKMEIGNKAIVIKKTNSENGK